MQLSCFLAYLLRGFVRRTYSRYVLEKLFGNSQARANRLTIKRIMAA
jgi:hypothetical protein